MGKVKLVLLAAVFVTLAGTTAASELSFEASVDRNRVSLGESIKLSLTLNNVQDVSAFNLPALDGFQTRYLGPSTLVSIVNGKVSSSTTHNYLLIPLKEGSFTLGPFAINYQNQTYTSRPLKVEVVKGPVAAASPPQPASGPAAELKDRIFLVMTPGKDKVYLKEIIPLAIKLYVSDLSVRDVQLPRFEHEGFSVEEYQPPQQYSEVLNGRRYSVVEFKTKIFGIKSGEFILGPADIECNIVVRKNQPKMSTSFFDDFFGENVFGNFFGRYQTSSLNLKSEVLPLTVLPLPPEGQPDDFKGAVGDFQFTVSAGPTEVRVGDPVTLKMVVSGQGNFNTVTTPQTVSGPDFKVYAPQITLRDNSKTFEQIFMPTTDKVNALPVVTFSFFDPENREYKTLARGPLPLKVRPSEEGELQILESGISSPIPATEKIGRGIIYIKSSLGKLIKPGDYLYKNKIFLWLQLLPLALLALSLAAYRKFERIRTDLRYARRLQAFKKAKFGLSRAGQALLAQKTGDFYNDIFKTLQEYLGDKFHLPVAGITFNSITGILREHRIKEDILEKLKIIFRDCDIARYAASEFEKIRMEKTLRETKEVIQFLEKQKI